MVKKAVLANFIKSNPDAGLMAWSPFLTKVRGLRVRTVGPKGTIQISLDDTGWFEPKVWLANYQASVYEELNDVLRKAETVLSPGKMNSVLLEHDFISASMVDSLTKDAWDNNPDNQSARFQLFSDLSDIWYHDKNKLFYNWRMVKSDN